MANDKSQVTQANSFEVIFKEHSTPLKFLNLSGLDMAVGLKEIQGGLSSQGPVLVRDRRAPGRVTLTKGSGKFTQDLQQWIVDSLNPDVALKRRDVDVTVYTPGQQASYTFTLQKAFPFAWSGPILSTESDQFTIDQLSLAFESLTQKVESPSKGSQSAGSTAPSSGIQYPTLSLKDGGGEIQFLCQPVNLRIRQGGEYEFLSGPGMPRPRPDFKHGRQRVLTTQLVVDFDLYAEKALEKNALYKQTDQLQAFLKPKDDTLEPPVLVFRYGDRLFEGYLGDLDISVEKFSSEGSPLRMVYGITMVESFEAKSAEDSGVF